MKLIARTTDNKRIVELTEAEYDSLSKFIPDEWEKGYAIGIAKLGLSTNFHNSLLRTVSAARFGHKTHIFTSHLEVTPLPFNQWIERSDLHRYLHHSRGIGMIGQQKIIEAIKVYRETLPEEK